MKERHNLRSRAIFRVKRILLQARRGIRNGIRPPAKLKRQPLLPYVVYESITLLRTGTDPKERLLTLGKIQNLRLVCRKLNGGVIESDQCFSFWFNVGKLTTRKGYVLGREVREGCIIPNVGGGICQLTNVLYQGALATGCHIVERHPHTIAVPGGPTGKDADATVAWNDIDLQFQPSQSLQLECRLDRDSLVVRFRSLIPNHSEPAPKERVLLRVMNAGSCVTCGQDDCDRHRPELLPTGKQHETLVMDAAWPEWKQYAVCAEGRLLVSRIGKSGSRFDWPASAEPVTLAAARRSLLSRRAVGKLPADVRAAALEGDRIVAEALAHRLKFDDDSLVIASNLLPHLWRTGVLDGRRFRVALVRPPLAMLHSLLDNAQSRHPEAATLSDFRAPEDLVKLENEALAQCDGFVTCHHGLAKEQQGPVELIPWSVAVPNELNRQPERLIAYPGPATARNGSASVRAAARALGLKVALLGSMLEDVSLWDGIELVAKDNWHANACAIVQPSVFENRPLQLIQASHLGVPIVSTSLCGLAESEFFSVEFGCDESLIEALRPLVPS